MLRLEQVSYSYIGKNVRVDAVREFSYHFEPAVFYAIMGPSGSGKSTLLHLISALDKPTRGDIFFDEKNISTIDPGAYRLKDVSLIFQNFCLLPFMTVLENVMHPARLGKRPAAKAKADAIAQLNKLGLDDTYYNRLPRTLSGGEQQRVAIARAMCTGSRLLLADEPTGNLDSTNAELIADIFSRLAHEAQRTVIMVTHDAAVAEKADVVLRLKDGRIAS